MRVRNETSLMLKSPLFRPVWLPTVVTAILLVLALVLLTGTAWRSLQRLQPVHNHLSQLNRLQQVGLHLEEMLIEQISDNPMPDVGQSQGLRQEISRIIALQAHLVPQTPQHLQNARAALADLTQHPRSALIASLSAIRQVLSEEARAHDQLMQGIRNNTVLEFKITLITIIVLPLAALVTLWLLRRRIFQPLNTLGSLLSLLARQDYKPAPTDTVDLVLKPLFDNYNHLVTRLAELEQQNKARQHSLENQVRSATHALLEQQRELGDAQRLAVVGEVAAGLAHELRNPLAGMQLALNNLREETQDPDHNARLMLIVNELNRTTGLLNALLNQTRQQQEATVDLALDNAIGELLTLAGYQLGEKIKLTQDIPSALHCRLPEGRLHQAILNLILNAAQAIGDQPGHIHIQVQQDAEQIQLSVNDDGPGFSQTHLDIGIRPFATGHTHGTGLGLVIVQRFAHDLGGKLLISNREPHGACVTLQLPCKGHHG